MKVVHVNNTANIGYLLCAGLRDAGVEAELWQQHPAPSTPRSLIGLYGFLSGNPYNVPMQVFGRGTRRSARAFDYAKWCVRMVRKASNIGVIHIHGPYLPEIWALRLVKRPKVICHFHGAELRGGGSLLGLCRMASNLLAKEDIALASTPDLLSLWKRRIVWFKNPVDPILFRRNQTCDHDRIFAPGRFEDFKGWQTIVRSWCVLRKLHPSASLRLISTGRHVEQAREMLRGDKRVTWLRPPKSGVAWANEMSSACVIWGQHNPHRVIGVVELEGLASGRPVIAGFDSRRYPDDYRPPIISLYDPRRIAEQTALLLQDSTLRRKVADRSRAWVNTEHSLQVVTRRLLSIYASLTERP